VVGLTDAQLHTERGEAIVHEAFGHRVWLHPETHLCDAKPQLYHGFWTGSKGRVAVFGGCSKLKSVLDEICQTRDAQIPLSDPFSITLSL
jgi:D-lyxose ketol-isomerase